MRKVFNQAMVVVATLLFCVSVKSQTIAVAHNPAWTQSPVNICVDSPSLNIAALHSILQNQTNDPYSINQIRGHVTGTCSPTVVYIRNYGQLLATVPIINNQFWVNGLNLITPSGQTYALDFSVDMVTGNTGCPAGSYAKVSLDYFSLTNSTTNATSIDTVPLAGDSITIVQCTTTIVNSVSITGYTEILGGDSLFGTWSGTQPDSIQIRLSNQTYGYTLTNTPVSIQIHSNGTFSGILKGNCGSIYLPIATQLFATPTGFWNSNGHTGSAYSMTTPNYYMYASSGVGANGAFFTLRIHGIHDSTAVLFGTASAYSPGGTSFFKDSIRGYYSSAYGDTCYIFYPQVLGLTPASDYKFFFDVCVGGIETRISSWDPALNQPVDYQVFQTKPCANIYSAAVSYSITDTLAENITFSIKVPHSLQFTYFPYDLTIFDVTTGNITASASSNNALMNDWWTQSQLIDTVMGQWNFGNSFHACHTYQIAFRAYGPCGDLSTADTVTFTIPGVNCPTTTTGINEATTTSATLLTLYPNPATTKITIANLSETADEIIVTSVTGQVIQAVKLSHQTQTTLDISDLPNGVYILKAGPDSKQFIVAK
jgi:hypothetical protein